VGIKGRLSKKKEENAMRLDEALDVEMKEKVYYQSDDGKLRVTDVAVTTASASYPITDITNMRLICLMPAKWARLILILSLLSIVLGIFLLESFPDAGLVKFGFIGFVWWFLAPSGVRLNTGGTYDVANPSLVRKAASYKQQLVFSRAITEALREHKQLMDRKQKAQ
jgi:hypothetical protein